MLHPIMMTCSLPVIPLFASCSIPTPIPPGYQPSQSFVLDPSPPYTPIDPLVQSNAPDAQSESEDPDGWLPPYSESAYEADSDWD